MNLMRRGLWLLLFACSEAPQSAATQSQGQWVETRDVAPGTQCAAGGIEILIGIDDGRGGGIARDGILQASEVTSSRVVCTSATSDGGASVDASPRSLVETQTVSPGYLCEFGGSAIVSGLDDGAGGGTANNGTLEAGEVRKREPFCRSAQPLAVATGLDTLPANTTCRVPSGSSRTEGVSLAPAFGGMTFDLPVSLKERPGQAGRFFVTELAGKVKTFAAGDAAPTLAIDISSKVLMTYEPGLLELEFHPTLPEVYLYYVKKSSTPGVRAYLTLSRFGFMTNAPNVIDPASEQVILSLPKQHDEHNGGGPRFGPDGFLYVATGDDDDVPSNNAQDPNSLFGKILRIDVTSRPPINKTYAIPPDNPFVAGGGAPEVFALGFRNPWRGGFDKATGLLWVGDVGATTYEEIDVVKKGKNYGWGKMEGNHCFDGELPVETGCTKTAFEPPVYEYTHAEGCSITGGPVVRGGSVPAIDGQFLYADFCQGMVWGLNASAPSKPRWLLATTTGSQPFDSISAFSSDASGQIYMLAMGGFGVPGKIYTLVSAAPSGPAANLSQTGCIDPARRDQPAQGAIPYNVNAPFFSSDTLYKERFLYLPPNGKIFAANDGRLVLPVGSIVMKTFRDGPKMIETRLMMYHSDGEWSGWSYKWKDDQSDATLLEGSASTTLSSGETWTFPDRGDCLHCHTRPVLRTIGFESAQFNRDSYYPSTGRWANQLATLRSIGALQNPLPAEPVLLPALANPRDINAPLEKRARSYLHTNCAHCHQPGGGGYGNADYRFATPLTGTNACNASPIVSTFGLIDGKIIAPGAPGRSVLVERMSRSDAHRMNPYRETIDGSGIALMQNWIGSLQNCTGP